MNKKIAAISKATEVTLEDIIALTNLSKTFILERAREGCFKAERHGVYKLGNVFLGLVKYYKEQRTAAQQNAASVEVQKARADQIRQRTAREARELISFKEHMSIVDLIVGGCRSFAENLPARLTRDLAQRSEYENIVHNEMRQLTAKWAKLADDADGKEAAEHDEGDDE